MVMKETNHEPGVQHSRETFLAMILLVFLGLGTAVFLIFVSGGFFFWVILVSAGLGLLIALHYLVWGRFMDASVQEERDRLEHEAEQESSPEPPWERRF
jgi:hypothetical protein